MAFAGSDDLPIYRIEYSDAAEEELGQAYLWQSSLQGPEAADRWVRLLRAAVNDLTTLPRRFERAPEYLSSGKDVRRLLVRPWRVLYQVIEPAGGEMEGGVVRVLHIYHGARRGTSATGASDQTDQENRSA
jgi:plasmid stabilization system protein ParE